MTTVSELCVNAIRGLLVADQGNKLVVADLSNIEGRVAAWLANEEWKLKAFRDFDTITGYDEKGEAIRKGHDPYKIGAGRVLGKRPEDVTKLERQNEGKVPELACLFQGAVGAFATMGANFGVVLPEDRVIEIIKAWRKQHPRVVSTWYAIEDAAKAAIRFPDERFEVNGCLHFDSVDGWLRIRLPSGQYLNYPNARIGQACPRCDGTGRHLESGVANATKMVVCIECGGTGKADTQVRYDGVDQYTKKWGTIASYGGKFFENCIAAGTLTLTDAGWLPIEQVRLDHRLWDGEGWVQHEGLAFKGVREVIAAHGVMMTPDHEVLTTEGWVSASQSEGYNRASCRLPSSTELRRSHGQETLRVERRMRMRKDISDGCVGSVETAKNRQQSLLWMPQERDDRRKEHQARHVSAPGLRGLAKYVRQVSAAVSQSVEELRRARDFGVRALAEVFLCLLGGYGAYLRERAHVGPYRQQRRVFAGELPMGFTQKTSAQQAGQHDHRHPVGSSDSGRDSGTRQPEQDDAALPSIYRCEGLAPVYSAEPFQPVLDVVNCGPRRRFVVLSSDGRPLIVHNCVQSTARDVFMCGFRAAERMGYTVVARVHDELITEVPDDPRFSAERLSVLMATNPPWAVGLPLAAAGHEMYRYAKLD